MNLIADDINTHHMFYGWVAAGDLFNERLPGGIDTEQLPPRD
jgi:hypothetical protein